MADVMSMRVGAVTTEAMAAFILGQAESSPIYEAFRMKFTMTGSLSKDETISTYEKNTVKDYDFEREWTWDRTPILPDTGNADLEVSIQSGFPQSGTIQFFSRKALSTGECYISPEATNITSGDDGIDTGTYNPGGYFAPDISKPGDVAILAATTNSPEVIGTETITYTGTGSPPNPSPTNITGNIEPGTQQPAYGGDVTDAFWHISAITSLDGIEMTNPNNQYDITDWGLSEWMDKRGVFSVIYNVPTPAGWDTCDVVMTWEWEFS
jgi:hypothetical protein